MEEIILETRGDLVNFLYQNQDPNDDSYNYEYIILKYSATWCKPCSVVKPIIEKELESIDKRLNGVKNKYIFVEVDVDECFDLYAFLKKQKMINGIPALFLYSRKIYKDYDKDKMYIPQASISGTKEDQIKKVLNLIN